MSRVARLGAFIVATLAILACGVFIIGSKAYLFRSTYKLQAQFDNVAGLAAGAGVQVGGVHSGTVHSIALPHRPGDKVVVVMDLDSSTHEIIKHDSVASIETEGLLGNQYLAISFGSGGQADVHDGDTIQSEPPLQMADLLAKANGILSGSQTAIQNVSEATAHLNSVSAKIDSGKGSVGELINDKELYSNLKRTTGSLSETMVQAQVGVSAFRENMEALKQNFFLRGYYKKRGYEDSEELVAHSIERLPQSAPTRTFTYSPKQLFGGRDSIKLQNQKVLNEGGGFLEKVPFGLAVIVVSGGLDGDSEKELELTKVRAMVIRTYLVEHFAFDDSQIRTLALGKQPAEAEAASGAIQLIVFPAVNEVPPSPPKAGVASKAATSTSSQGTGSVTPKP